jgi:nucleoside-diphosphate-sugar epimerase
MTVLITGGTGFVGLNVAECLLARGEHVVLAALDHPPLSAQRAFAKLPGRFDSEICDVRDSLAFAALLRRHQVDRLFPFAAITPGPDREREIPERILEVNVVALVAQLRAARDVGVRRVVVPSSSAVYGESFYDTDVAVEETTPCRPTALYGISKCAAERSALRLARLWDLDITAARIGGVFGPWERDTGLRDMLSAHWQLARSARNGEVAILPSEIPAYSWIYARDAAAALVHLLDQSGMSGQVFNVCSGVAWGPVILRWCERLKAMFPGFSFRQAAHDEEANIRLVDSRSRAPMDITRIVATGWSPRFLPDDAYADYAEWIAGQAGAAEAT